MKYSFHLSRYILFIYFCMKKVDNNNFNTLLNLYLQLKMPLFSTRTNTESGNSGCLVVFVRLNTLKFWYICNSSYKNCKTFYLVIKFNSTKLRHCNIFAILNRIA